MDTNANQPEHQRSQEADSLPPELAWEQMEAGILQKMEAARNAGKPTGPNNNRGPILIGILLLLLLIPMYCTLTGDASPTQETVVVSPPQASPAPQPGDTRQGIGPSTAQSAVSDRAISPSAMVPNGSDTLEAGKTAEKRQARARIPNQQTDNPVETQSAPDAINTAVDTNQLPDSTNRSQRPEAVAATPVAPSRYDHAFPADRLPSYESQNGLVAARATALLPSKSYLVRGTEKAPDIPALFPPSFSNAKESAPTVRSPRRFSILAGVADWDMGYGTGRPERAAYESPLLSWQGGISYLHPLPKRYSVLAGLQWQRLESRLDWSAPVDDYQIILRDTLLRVETNAVTGKESKIRGDVTLTVPADRVVRHHNPIQLMQIPLAVGRTWLYRNWQADLLVGGAVSVFSYNRGRTLYQGEISDYAGSETEFLANQWQFSALLAGRLTYQINPRLGLTTGVQWQKSVSNWSKEPNTTMRPRILSVQLGVTYSGR